MLVQRQMNNIVWQRFQDKILIKIKSLAQLPMTVCQLAFRLNPIIMSLPYLHSISLRSVKIQQIR
jgi:hypothetical protein